MICKERIQDENSQTMLTDPLNPDTLVGISERDNGRKILVSSERASNMMVVLPEETIDGVQYIWNMTGDPETMALTMVLPDPVNPSNKSRGWMFFAPVNRTMTFSGRYVPARDPAAVEMKRFQVRSSRWSGSPGGCRQLKQLGRVRHIPLALDKRNDRMHISYLDYSGTWGDAGNLIYRTGVGARWDQPFVVDDTISWTTRGDTEMARYTSIALDPDGNPHIAYYNPENATIMYAVRKNGNWQKEIVAGTSGTYTMLLALHPDGTPAITYGDGFCFGNLMYAVRTGSGWIAEKVDNGGDVGNGGHHSSLAFDTHGTPHISYNSGRVFANLKYATKNGDAWIITKVDTGGPVGDTGYESSLVLDRNDRPHIAYREQQLFANLMVAEQDPEGNWIITKVDNGGGTNGDTGHGPSIALDSAGLPHVSYVDNKYGLGYAASNGAFWTKKTIASIHPDSRRTSLAIDSRDRLFIGYFDDSHRELRVATRSPDSQQWEFWTVNSCRQEPCDNVAAMSLALDGSGHPDIAYYDVAGYMLNYAEWTG